MNGDRFKHFYDFIDSLPNGHLLKGYKGKDKNFETEKFLCQIDFGMEKAEKDSRIKNNGNHSSWLQTKLSEIQNPSSSHPKNQVHSDFEKQVSSNLGEIQAFGLLRRSHFEIYKALLSIDARQDTHKLWLNFPSQNLLSKVDSIRNDVPLLIKKYSRYRRFICRKSQF